MRRLKDRITFIEADTISDLAGGFEVVSTLTLYECWANVEQNNSNRAFQNFQVANMVIVTVSMRVNPEFAPQSGQNVLWKDRFLTVQGEPDLNEQQFYSFQAAYDPKIKVSEQWQNLS
jgi:hypothetical protein